MKAYVNGINRFGFGAEHEARLYQLLIKELTEYAVFFINPDRRIASWNSGVERILGYSQDEFLGLPFSILFTQEDQLAGIPERELTTAKDSGSASDERWHLRRSGERFFATGMVVSSHDASGQLIGCTKIIRDHTSEKLAEERLRGAFRKSKELAHALDLTHTMIRDMAGTIRVWTRGAQELYGWTADEAVGASSHRLLRTEFPEPLEEIEEKLRRAGGWEGELKHFSKNGRELFVASHWMLPDSDAGEGVTVIEVNNDITDRKAVETELRESEERFRKVFEESPIGMAFIRPESGRYLRVNAAFAQMLGYQEEDFAHLTIADVTHPDDFHAPAEEDRRGVFRGELPFLLFEKRYLTRSGTVVWASIREVLIRDAQGRPECNLGIIEDITRRRQLEEELLRANEELAQFSSTAAHDLQTPLRNMKQSAQFLAKRYLGQLDPVADEFIQHIVSGANRMQDLIEALLAYARSGEADGHKGPVQISTVLETVLTNLRAEIEKTEAKIVFDALPTVEADAIQLSRLLQNLIGNALKYRSEAPPRITITAEKQQHTWRFSVRDNGIGIPAGHLDSIFAPLKRLHGPEIQGTGIGLAICKKIVERTGGKIWAESQIGQGSTFYFTLPAAEVHPVAAPM